MIMAVAMLAAGAFGASAQSFSPRVEVGAAFANMHTKTSSQNNSGDLKLGLRVAAVAEFALIEPAFATIYVAPGVAYKMGGAKTTDGKVKAQVASQAVSIPVNLGLRAKLGETLGVSVEFGPYFDYTLSSKLTNRDLPAEDLLGKNGNMKRFDAGLGISAALEYSKFFVRLGTEFGMINQIKDAPRGSSMTNNSFYTTLGIRF